MTWYEDWFDRDEYEIVYQRRDEEEAGRMVDLIERVISPQPGAAVLDVACGRGRHAIELARRGYAVTGTDLSLLAIRRARARAAEAGMPVRFERRDMREPLCEACFDITVNLFTAFGYFEDESENQKALQAMAHTVRPGGWFVQDYLNAPFVRRHLQEMDERDEDGVHIHQKRWIENERINKEITLVRNGDAYTIRESVRLFTLKDLQALYDHAGLRIEHVFGDYRGGKHNGDAPRLILFARRMP
jgi:SAM-dependent methyltransferase